MWSLLILSILVVIVSESSKFEESFTIGENGRVGPILEGPMYGTDGGFIGIVTGVPFVGFEGTASFVDVKSENALAANLTIFHTSSLELLNIFNRDIPFYERRINASSMCDNEGMASRDALLAFGRLDDYQTFPLNGQSSQVSFKSLVARTGYQYIVFILCRNSKTLADEVTVEVSGELSFKNPYGYLPARYYGFLPFLGLLSCAYLVLLLVFGYLVFRHRSTMLKMQWGILGVVIMGLIETTTWFMTYVVMNDTGETSCCPWRSDIVFAMFAKNLKQTVSGLLVLAVALGWGVVKASLSRRMTLIVLLLGFFYLAFSVKFDLVRMEQISKTDRTTNNEDEEQPEGSETAFWAFPVAFCDVVFILSIYFALVETCIQLEADRQHAKLQMYQTLVSTLKLWGLLWFGFTIFDLLTRIGFIPWPWTLEFLLWGFWDLFYFFVLLRIAIIWRPTETSDRYAYSAQLPTADVLDEFETQEFEANSDARELELAKN